MSDLITVTDCKNCGQQITTYNFCPDCGAKKITKRITFKNLISDFVNRFLNVDNSFFKTFIHLFSKPDEVIDGYIHGLRKRYINPFSYFALSVTITGIYSFLTEKRLEELMNTIDTLSKEQLEIQQAAMDTSFQYQSIISLLLIPILALISRLVFVNYKKYNLTEHFVIYLYSYSHIVGLMTILLLPITFLSDSIITITIVQFVVYITYIAYVLKRLYQINLKKIIIKTILFLILGGLLYILIGIISFLVMLINGTFEMPTK